MQSGMGAHQLIAPGPVQAPVDGRAYSRQRPIAAQKMQDLLSLFLHSDDRRSPTGGEQRPEVAGLPSPARIKGRAVQDNSPFVRLYRDNFSLEFLQVTIGLIQQFCHDGSLENIEFRPYPKS